MKLTSHFQLAHANIIHEKIEGEVVILNLDNGSYYGLAGCANEIWQLVNSDLTLADIIAQISKRYAGNTEEINSSITSFINQLVEEDLLVILETPINNQSEEITSTAPQSPFVAPTLNKFTDMQELLMLDPIHEIDETGWPNKKVE